MQSQHTDIKDFVAIGVGPFNLGLACLTATIPEVNGLFLDQKPNFNWHPGMLLQDTTLQIPFMADLVTLADPTHPFSFLNYLKQKGKLYAFYIKEDFLLLRNEYNQYCQWAIQQLDNVQFHTQVNEIVYSEPEQCYIVIARCLSTNTRKLYKARKLVLGTGTQPYVPKCCRHLQGKAIHSSSYLQHKAQLQAQQSITIVGSGQSAAEIFYDLLQDIDEKGYALHWITRSPRFFPLEYSKLTLEMTSPEYVDYFYSLPPHKREQLNAEQKQLYKGINQDLIASIFDLMYTKKVTHEINVQLRTNSTVEKVTHDASGFALEIHQHEQDKYYAHHTEGLVLATGYAYQMPKCIEGISDRIRWDDKGRYDVQRNYSIDTEGNSIFVQNAELHTHGFVTPDLGMACYRNSYILKAMTGKEYYPIEKRIAFQQFEVTEAEEIHNKAVVL